MIVAATLLECRFNEGQFANAFLNRSTTWTDQHRGHSAVAGSHAATSLTRGASVAQCTLEHSGGQMQRALLQKPAALFGSRALDTPARARNLPP